MVRQKAVLAFIVLLSLLLPSYIAHAAGECTAKKFVHVKLNPFDILKGGLVMDEFHLTDETNHDDGAFNLGQDYYDENHKCGIMVHTIGSFSVHGVDMVWAGKLGKLSKGSSGSIADDLGQNYYACDPRECSTNPACKAGNGLMVLCNWKTEVTSDGIAGPGGVIGADVTFGAKYGDATGSGSDVSLSVSAQKYGPKNDVLCGDDGKWHECDSQGCACVANYQCTADGKWEWCPYSCKDGVCQIAKPAEHDCQDILKDKGESTDAFPKACNIKVKVVDFSTTGDKQYVSLTVTYNGEDAGKSMNIECNNKENDVSTEGDKRCFISCDGIFPDLKDNGKLKPALKACYDVPAPKPVDEPDVKDVPKPVPKPIDDRNPVDVTKVKVDYKEPVVKCEQYYGVLEVLNESGAHPEVKDPPECKFTQKVTVDNSPDQKCAMVENDGSFDAKDYQVIDIPPCAQSAEDFAAQGIDVFGVLGTQKKKEPVDTECPGEITIVDTHIPENNNDIIFSIAFKNTGKISCEYKPCVYGLKDGTGDRSPAGDKKPAEWQEMSCYSDYVKLSPGQESSVEISSTGNLWNFISDILKGNIKDLTGWNVRDLNGKIDIKLFSRKDSEDQKEVDDKENAVCKDNALELCHYTEMKMDQSLGKEVPQIVYGVVDTTKYEVKANDQKDDKENLLRYWLINRMMFHDMDVDECSRPVEGSSDLVDVKFYTIVRDAEYRKYVQDHFGLESSYKKYSDMGYDADYLYCYKTDLRNTSRCREFNQLMYSMTLSGNNPRYIDSNYLKDIRDWNLYQTVDEITPLDKGYTWPAPAYDPYPCSLAMDRDYYIKGDNITLTYMNAPPGCYMRLYALSLDGKTWNLKKEWKVESWGNETYMPLEADVEQRWEASLSMGSCAVKDDALVNITAAKNVMSKIFAITPLLDDTRNNARWTKTGNDTLFIGTGLDRYDKCEVSCDSKKNCNTFEEDKCLPFSGTDECSKCSIENKKANAKDCTQTSGSTCPDSNLHDCWNKVCKIDSSFSLQADVGKSDGSGSFYGLPYDKNTGCPPGGFEKKDVVSYDHQWTTGDTPKTEQKCVVPAGVLAITRIDFPSPQSVGKVDIAFVVDTSGSMEDEWNSLCNVIKDVVADLQLKGIDLKYTIYGMGGTSNIISGKTCEGAQLLSVDKLKSVDSGIDVKNDNCARESWGPGCLYVSANNQWRDTARKIVIPIGDAEAICGWDAPEWDNAKIDQAAASIKARDVTVYGLYGDPGPIGNKQKLTDEMNRLSKGTGAEQAYPFSSSEEDLKKKLEDIAKPNDDQLRYVVSSTVFIKNRSLSADDNVWELYQEDTQAIKVDVPADVDTRNPGTTTTTTTSMSSSSSGGTTSTSTTIPAKQVDMTLYPSFHAILRGNMPFNITYVNITNESTAYVLRMIYVPKDAADDGRKLVVTAGIDFNYTLLEHARNFVADVNTTYVSQLTRNKYYTSCNHQPCDCSCGGDSSALNYGLSGGDVDSCGGLSREQTCSCDCGDGGSGCTIETTATRREIETQVVNDTYSETDRLPVQGIGHADVACGSLTQLDIEGTIDQLVDEKGNVVIASSIDNPIRITMTPDILGGFVLKVNESFITYNALIYPVRHILQRKESGPIPDTQVNNYDDMYKAQDTWYDFPEQCKNTCPSMLCDCNAGQQLQPECFYFGGKSISRAPRTDCACVAQGCYADPCVSERDYHEEEGSAIANGDFEGGLEPYWKLKSGDANVVFHGITGKALNLSGAVEQDIPGMHTLPYDLLCLEYGMEKYPATAGKLDLTVTLDGIEKKYNIWTFDADCKGCMGWKKSCFPVVGHISKIRLESDTAVLVDNVNIGKYYDYIGLYSYDVPKLQYMDSTVDSWDSYGLLRTDGVSHVDNVYTFNFRSLPRETVETTNGYATGTFTYDDFDKGYMVLDTFYDPIVIPLYPNTMGRDRDPSSDEAKYYPVCYKLNLTWRDATTLDVSTSPTGYTVAKGSTVTVKGKLLYHGSKQPLANQRIYFDLNGEDIWGCSPSSDLKRDYIFNINEIAGNKDQQKNLVDLFRSLGSKQFDQIALDLEGATYSSSGGKVTITPKKGSAATLEIKDGRSVFTTADGKKIDIGVIGSADANDKNCVYASEYHKTLAYALTNDQGIASFTFISKGTVVSGSYLGGDGSPSGGTAQLHTISIKSPLLSTEFLFLALVLIFGVFSFRFFKDKRMDLYTWWREFKGRK